MATFEKIIEVAESLEWRVDQNDDGTFDFSTYSQAGREVYISFGGSSPEDMIKEVREYVEAFDISYETYIHLDSTGHGTNGAPYDLSDVLEDTEYIFDMIDELYNKLDVLL